LARLKKLTCKITPRRWTREKPEGQSDDGTALPLAGALEKLGLLTGLNVSD
jgi:hypothetical protein